jgi:tetratricopeptide (TPR) repeat protein
MAGRPVKEDVRLVGRDEELTLIDDACATARSGRGRLLVVRGEAGIGKTTLCERAARRADAEGFAVGWGRCWADGGAPPLWPWPAVLEALGGVDAARILDEDAGRSGLDPDRFARFAAVAELLAERSTVSPLMIVIDDAHVADPAALLLSRFLARSLDRSPLVLVLTRRPPGVDRVETAHLLDELEREATVLPLGSFDQRDTAEYLVAHGVEVEDYGLVPALTRLTDGNPLLLSRAVSHASRKNPMAGVEQVIGDVLGALPPEQCEVLALAAVLGGEATGADIVRMVGGAEADVVAALDGAAAAGLMDLGPSGWMFTHELVRRAALGVLTPQETMAAHGRALELIPPDGRPATVIRRAHHALGAAGRSDDNALQAVDACRAAARVVAHGFDYERAADLAGVAVKLGERVLAPAEYVEVLLESADALLACGRLSDARRVYQRAAETAVERIARARAALGLGGVWLDEHRGQAERHRVLALQRDALVQLPPQEVGLRALLRVRLAAEAVYDGAPVEPVRTALAEARRVGEPRVLAEALSLSHHALLAPEFLDERLPLAEELIAVASHCGDELRTLFGLLWRAVDLYLGGDVRSERAQAELRERADAVGCRSISYVVAAVDVMRLIREGRLEAAEQAAATCFELGVEVGDADATGYYGAHLLTIRWFQDRQLELLETAKEVADSATLITPEFAFRATAAALAARAGDCEEARARVGELCAEGLSVLPRSSTWLMGITAIVDVARLIGDRRLAEEAYQLLLPFADRPIMPSLAVTCFGSTEWALGVAALTLGDVDPAIEHLSRGVDANVRLGHRPMTMLVLSELAEALVARDRGNDRQRATDAFGRAAEIADDIGVPARAGVFRDRAATIGGEVVPADVGVLRKDGDRWIVVAGSRRAVTPDLVGVQYLGTLLTNPGAEIPAVELCGGTTLEQGGQELVDRETVDAYRRRVAEIDDAIVRADAVGDHLRASHLGQEREALRLELGSVLAMAGRSRRFVDSSERARTAVRKAIARAIDAIAESDETIASELRATITTGRACTYFPDPRHPRRWSVRRAS